LDAIEGYYHVLLVNDEDNSVIRHDKSKQRPVLPNGDYEHACLSIVDENMSFNSLPYRPSVYPDQAVSDLEVFTFDDGNERKVWAIKETQGDKAHAFYENTQTSDRLVHQLVDLTNNSVSQRITQKLQDGYTRLPNKYDFKPKSRALISIS